MFGYNEQSDFDIICIFCAVPIEYALEASCSRWRCEYRALYNEEGEWNSPRVSGIGDRSIDDVVPVDFTKHRKEYGHDDTPSADLRLIWMKPRDNPDYPHGEWDDLILSAWGVLGHASCWRLFDAACHPSETYLDALNHLCRSAVKRAGFSYLGLDYGRVPSTTSYILGWKYGDERSIESAHTFAELRTSPRTRMYKADPMLLDLSQSFDRRPATRSTSKFCNSGIPLLMEDHKRPKLRHIMDPMRADRFVYLPEEIRLLILSSLPCVDVVNAKIASVALAITNLGAPFWKSRFDPGQQFHCIFERPSYLARPKGWKELFRISKSLRNHPSFQNRQRIWKALLQLKAILSIISSRNLYGKALRSAFERKEELSPPVKRFISAKVLIPEIKENPSKWDFYAVGSGAHRSGCKALFSRLALIPADIDGMSATLVHHNEQTFISGLIFRSRSVGAIYIGYVDHDHRSSDFARNRVSADFPQDHVVGFRISSCQAGLCGIRAIFATGLCSTTLGFMGSLPKSQVTLTTYEDFTLVCDFDAFKMLRFGIRESNSVIKGKAIHGRSRIYRDDYQWCPDIPDDSCILSEPRVLQKERPLEWKEYLPRMICMYGGEHGELLGKITKFTVWFMGNSIVGIEFHYGDASIILGKRDPFRHTTDGLLAEVRKRHGASWHTTCDLNGPGGEVITDFIVLQNPDLCHLEICTNFGRVFQTGFEPGRMAPTRILEPKRIKRPKSATIVGIYADLHEWCKFGVLGTISKEIK